MVIQRRFIIYIVLLSIVSIPLVNKAQNGTVYVDPNRGEKKFRKEQVMDANRAQSILGNWGMFGKRDDKLSGVWPKGTGHGHVHEMTMLVAAEVVGNDGNLYQIASESYSESPDRAPNGTEFWWNPLPGYANEDRYVVNPSGLVDSTSKVAASTDKSTWPAVWPGKDGSWDNTWNGYFGKNQFNADKEAIYVIDDFNNSEFPYYPVASDETKRGLGMQVETRLFQWAHPLAQDQIFIHFQVTNISDNVYDRNVFLGAFADTHPGGLGSSNDMNDYSNSNNMVYAWAKDNIGIWSTFRDILPGYMAWKYLESPGQIDGVDNDNDGLIDERRDNDAGYWIESGPVGNYGPDKPHWSGDEDGDWDVVVDDVGSDGIGPLDLNYVAPDFDGTEGNGMPDQGEPNFGKTDNDESDQIGLTSFYAPSYGSLTASNDGSIWQFIQPGNFERPENESNRLWIFASGPFILDRQQTERFSVCWLFGADEKEIFRNAFTSQQIYDNDYRFTKPPLTPTVKAVAGDKKVTLYWDNIAEKSLDPVYGRDFEGYRIYKGTDPQLTDAQLITNAYGNFAYYKPIALFDVVDGIKGLHPVALGQELGNQYSTGVHYDMGNDSGIEYYYEDTDVLNGVTYYYAVVSYDQGYYDGMDERNLVKMSPSECSFEITYQYGALTSISQNCVIVTPNTTASNYKPGYTDADENGYIAHALGSSTGKVSVTVIDADAIPDNNHYEVSFVDELNNIGEIHTTKYSVKNSTTGEILLNNTPVPTDSVTQETLKWSSPVIEGMQLNFENTVPDPIKVSALSGWSDDSQTNLVAATIFGGSALVPFSFILEITAEPAHYPFKATEAVYYKIYDTATLDTLDFQFSRDQNKDGKINHGDVITILQRTSDDRYIKAWRLGFSNPSDASIPVVDPQPGDKYYFVCDMPFRTTDQYEFSTTASSLTKVDKKSLNNVAVVPNPYLLSASWERASDLTGRGERKISFIHLPAECKVRIFTQNGILIKTIDHSGNYADGSEFWDLTTDEGLEVAFGIYVFHIDAPGIGQKIGTFAIIN